MMQKTHHPLPVRGTVARTTRNTWCFGSSRGRAARPPKAKAWRASAAAAEGARASDAGPLSPYPTPGASATPSVASRSSLQRSVSELSFRACMHVTPNCRLSARARQPFLNGVPRHGQRRKEQQRKPHALRPQPQSSSSHRRKKKFLPSDLALLGSRQVLHLLPVGVGATCVSLPHSPKSLARHERRADSSCD